MIKILVTSDIHGDSSILNLLSLSYPNFDYYLDLGDSCLPNYQVTPFISVKGNNDYGYDYPPSRTINTKYGKIYMSHGDYYFTDEDILNKDVLIYLTGHTHIRKLVKFDDHHYYANPGSLSRPRDNKYGTYLIITIDENKVNFQFKDIEELL